MDDQDDLLEGTLYPVLSPIPVLTSTCLFCPDFSALTCSFSWVINLYISSAGEFSAKEEEYRRDAKKEIPIPNWRFGRVVVSAAGGQTQQKTKRNGKSNPIHGMSFHYRPDYYMSYSFVSSQK